MFDLGKSEPTLLAKPDKAPTMLDMFPYSTILQVAAEDVRADARKTPFQVPGDMATFAIKTLRHNALRVKDDTVEGNNWGGDKNDTPDYLQKRGDFDRTLGRLHHPARYEKEGVLRELGQEIIYQCDLDKTKPFGQLIFLLGAKSAADYIRQTFVEVGGITGWEGQNFASTLKTRVSVWLGQIADDPESVALFSRIVCQELHDQIAQSQGAVSQQKESELQSVLEKMLEGFEKDAQINDWEVSPQ